MNRHVPFDRAQIGSWASVAGGLALVAGGVLFLLKGEISLAVFGCVAAGVVLLALWMIWSPGEFQAWMSGRQTRFGTTSLLISILFTGFVVAVYILVDRANWTVDLTRAQRYSLNSPTLDVIDRLKEQGYRVRITGFFSRYKLREQESADLLLRLYRAAGDGAIEIEYLDPDENPDLAGRYGYQPGYDGSLFLAVLGVDGEPDFQSAPLYLGGVSERNITTGLKKVVSAGTFTIYFTTGHGERELDRVDESGISRLRISLLDVGIAVEPLSLLNVADSGIPAEADAVFIVGARAPFNETEVQVLDEYLQRGGRLAIFTDPPLVEALAVGSDNTFLQEGSVFSNYLWGEFGVRVRDQLVIETESYFDSELRPIINTTTPNSLLDLAYNAQIIMQLARSLEITTEPDSRQGRYVREPILYTSQGAFGESDLVQVLNSQIGYDEGMDSAGPLIVGVAVRRSLEIQEEVQPRIVIIGDSDVVKNEFVAQYPGNTWLWTDVVNWLTGFEQAVSFTPVTDPTRLPLVVSDQQRHTIATLTMLVLPGLVLLAGIGVWWYRRR